MLLIILTTNPELLISIFKELLPYAGILFSAWIYHINSNKEGDKAAADDLKKLKSDVINHGLMFTANEQVREHLVDKNNIRLDNLEARVNHVDSTNSQVFNKVQQLEVKQEMQNAIISRLELSVNELKCDMREQSKEIIELIKTMRK